MKILSKIFGLKHWQEYGIAFLVTAVSTVICFTMFSFFERANLVMIYLLGVMLVSLRGCRGASVFAAALSVICFDFCFVPPRFKFSVEQVQYIWTFVVMFAAALLISHLTLRLRNQAQTALKIQKRTAMIHSFTQHLSTTRGLHKILQAAVHHVGEVFNSDVIAFIPDSSGHLIEKTRFGQSKSLTEQDLGLAQWVFDRWQAAGLGTLSLPSQEALYLPLQGEQGTVGVLRISPREANFFGSEQRVLLDSFAHQIALALEVHRLEENVRSAELQAQEEALRNSLLSSVSHDLRTPLAAILGSTQTLLQNLEFANHCPERELLKNIEGQTQRLARLVQNLLQVTRLESGKIQLQKEFYPLEEVIGNALERLDKLLKNHKILTIISDNLPIVFIDGILFEQVFVNLLENALRFAPEQTKIKISAKVEKGEVLVSVSDEGCGLEQQDLERIFEKFYHSKSSCGAGLGLAICRAIVQVHGGRIWAENIQSGGAIFYFTISMENKNG